MLYSLSHQILVRRKKIYLLLSVSSQSKLLVVDFELFSALAFLRIFVFVGRSRVGPLFISRADDKYQ